jgi:glutathione S-transferase
LKNEKDDPMSLVFYSSPMSTAEATEAVLVQLKVPFERVEMNIQKGDTRTPEFLKLNPNGCVPTIVHDGVVLWESAAIAIYLGEVFGVSAGLYPEPGPQRAEALKWLVWTNATLAEAAGRLSQALPPNSPGGVEIGASDWKSQIENRTALAEEAKVDLNQRLKILNEALQDKEYLLGKYSIVDAHMHAFVGWIAGMGMSLKPYPKVHEWLEKCASR